MSDRTMTDISHLDSSRVEEPTCNPLGTLNKMPRELRDHVYRQLFQPRQFQPRLHLRIFNGPEEKNIKDRIECGLFLTSKTIALEVWDACLREGTSSIKINPNARPLKKFYDTAAFVQRVRRLEIHIDLDEWALAKSPRRLRSDESMENMLDLKPLIHDLPKLKHMCARAMSPFHGKDIARKTCLARMTVGPRANCKDLNATLAMMKCFLDALGDLTSFQCLVITIIHPQRRYNRLPSHFCDRDADMTLDWAQEMLRPALGQNRQIGVKKHRGRKGVRRIVYGPLANHGAKED